MMFKINPLLLFLAFFSLLLLCPHYSNAMELSGNFSGETRLFLNEPSHEGQKRDSASIAVEPELYHEINSSSSFTMTPFIRVDSAEGNRTHFDMRDFFFMKYGETWETRVGLDKVFWGVTESAHLLDIINQTDTLAYWIHANP